MRKNSKSQTNHMKNSNHRVRFYLPGNHPNHPPKTRSPTLSIHYIQVGMLLTLRWASAANPDLVALLHAIFSVFLLSNYNELPHRKYTCELIRSLNVTRTVVVCTNNMYVCSRLDARFSTDSARARPPASCYYFSSPSLYLQRLPPETRARVCVCMERCISEWVRVALFLCARRERETVGNAGCCSGSESFRGRGGDVGLLCVRRERKRVVAAAGFWIVRALIGHFCWIVIIIVKKVD